MFFFSFVFFGGKGGKFRHTDTERVYFHTSSGREELRVYDITLSSSKAVVILTAMTLGFSHLHLEVRRPYRYLDAGQLLHADV